MNLFRLFSSLIILSDIPLNTFGAKVDTVDIDPQYYTGLWYQTYGDEFVLSTFERNAYCCYANYSLMDDNRIDVFNWERVGSVDGTVQNISGYAMTTQDPGQLVVYFSGNPPAPYWVIKIGPIVNDEYQYSVVSDPFMLGLYVLARNVDEYYQNYNDEVQSFLNDTGFQTIYNTPVQVVHDGCDYNF